MNDAAPRDGFSRLDFGDTFLDVIGPLWIRADADGATVLLSVDRRHLNPNGTVHGGVLMTLMDVALGTSLQESLRRETQDEHAHPVTIQISASMTGAARLGDLLEARGTVDRTTSRLGFSTGRIEVDGRLMMTASAVFRRPPGGKPTNQD